MTGRRATETDGMTGADEKRAPAAAMLRRAYGGAPSNLITGLLVGTAFGLEIAWSVVFTIFALHIIATIFFGLAAGGDAADLLAALGQGGIFGRGLSLVWLTLILLAMREIARAAVRIAARAAFEPGNARRFAHAAAWIAAAETLRATSVLTGLWGGAPSSADAVAFFMSFTFVATLAALAAAFRQGARLQQEQDLTV